MAAERTSRETNSGPSWLSIVAWVIALFGLTALGVAPLYIFDLDVHHLTPQTVTPIVGIGLELTAYAPSLAALLIAGFVVGSGGARPLLAQLGRWQRNLGWYAIALLGPLALFLLADAIRIAFGSPIPAAWLALPPSSKLAFAIGSVVAGSLGEEIGWRGFAQSQLQRHSGALVASLVVGVTWTIWHYWGVFAPGGLTGFTLAGFALSLLRMCALSVIYAWLYNGSRQSLPVAMVAHAGHNIANNIVSSTGSGLDIGEIVTFLYAASAIAIIFLTRKRLAFAFPAKARAT